MVEDQWPIDLQFRVLLEPIYSEPTIPAFARSFDTSIGNEAILLYKYAIHMIKLAIATLLERPGKETA